MLITKGLKIRRYKGWTRTGNDETRLFKNANWEKQHPLIEGRRDFFEYFIGDRIIDEQKLLVLQKWGNCDNII